MNEAIGVILIGSAVILAYLGRTSEDNVIKGLFSNSALAMMVGATNAARIMAVDGLGSDNLINTIWSIEFVFMLLLFFSIVYMLFLYIKEVVEKMGKIKSGEIDKNET